MLDITEEEYYAKLAFEKIASIRKEMESLNNLINRSPKVQSDCEKKIVSLYHCIELVPSNAAALMKMTSNLKRVLRLRRSSKDLYRYKQSIGHSLESCIKGIDQVSKAIESDREKWYDMSVSQIKEFYGD
jgi:septation ring formation regulator EzrA